MQNRSFLRSALAALLFVGLLSFPGATLAQDEGAPADPAPTESAPAAQADSNEEKVLYDYAYLLRAPRLTFDEDYTAEEEAKVGEHFQYLVKLYREGVVQIVGRADDLAFPGLVIYKAESDEAAKAIMENDPAVAAGVFRAEFARYGFALSRLAQREAMSQLPATTSDRKLVKEVVVNAPVDELWNAWTTAEGVTSFFAPKAKIELQVGGAYEVFFDVSAPQGMRGSEECRVLSFLPREMLSFEWNAPPSFGKLRGQKTRVVIEFDEVAAGWTRVKLTHLGWGEGDDWDGVYDYFDQAWSGVLASLKQTLETPAETPVPVEATDSEEAES